MKLFSVAAALTLGLVSVTTQFPNAPTGFDKKTNGMVDDATHQADQMKFDEVEQLSDGLGPLYNAQSCRECHQSPVSGAASQVTELRVGHQEPDGHFRNPEIPIAHGTEVIAGRSLVNDRAICPNAAFPNNEIQERVPETETIRTFRLSLNLLGDGFVEAVADQTFIDLAQQQCKSSHRKICGQILQVPIVEAPGQMSIGRFGWKDQHASLLAFAADAYLNEMGITSRLQPTEVTTACNPPVTTIIPNKDPTKITEPNSLPDPTDNNLEDIDHFASFMRSLKAPARDTATTPEVTQGEQLFTKIACASCHLDTIVTGKSPAAPGGPGLHPEALENRTIHPYSDFLLHNVGTGDGIAVALIGDFGRERVHRRMRELEGVRPGTQQPTKGKPEDECSESYQTAVLAGEKHPDLLRDTLCARNKIRTAPLWGLRVRSRLMHDGASVELSEAIRRHQ